MMLGPPAGTKSLMPSATIYEVKEEGEKSLRPPPIITTKMKSNSGLSSSSHSLDSH